MKILVVSGFLGAGKTTFIRTLAERTKKDFAVMENEYGAVNVDGDLLEQTNDLNIWELDRGMYLLFHAERLCHVYPDHCKYSGSGISDRRTDRCGDAQ